MPAIKGLKSCSPAPLLRTPIPGNFAAPDCFRPVSCANPLSGANTALLRIVKNSRRLMLPSGCIFRRVSQFTRSGSNASSACGQTDRQPPEGISSDTEIQWLTSTPCHALAPAAYDDLATRRGGQVASGKYSRTLASISRRWTACSRRTMRRDLDLEAVPFELEQHG